VSEKVWFITGTSRGFGRDWAIAALERGDKVAGTARDTATLDDLVDKYGDALLPIQLDVTDREADFAAVKRAHDHFGRLDIVVNNAGYGHFGFVEELSEQDAREQIETNVFGALWITQAALPYLREQRSGHIIQVSSIGGITAFPVVGIYHASKWALEGLSQALAQEVAPFGIHVTLIEPGGFDTDWAGSRRRPGRARQAMGQPGRPVGLGGRAAEGGRRRGAATAGVLRRHPAPNGQGRLREPATQLGAVAARRGTGAGVAHSPCA
jgi:NAD(P)-dependent dehydrogenase (short-subunit alcohol dehydrogenase family)